MTQAPITADRVRWRWLHAFRPHVRRRNLLAREVAPRAAAQGQHPWQQTSARDRPTWEQVPVFSDGHRSRIVSAKRNTTRMANPPLAVTRLRPMEISPARKTSRSIFNIRRVLSNDGSASCGASPLRLLLRWKEWTNRGLAPLRQPLFFWGDALVESAIPQYWHCRPRSRST
jgi:hypothetical protein